VDRLLTMEEAARQLAVSRWTVFRLVKQRQLVSILVASRCRRVTASSVEAYINRRLEEAA
jgi:excisionase family DNA binding protein